MPSLTSKDGTCPCNACRVLHLMYHDVGWLTPRIAAALYVDIPETKHSAYFIHTSSGSLVSPKILPWPGTNVRPQCLHL